MSVIRFPVERRDGPLSERLLRKHELADILDRSERWIELRMRDDGLPFVKPDRSVRFRLSQVQRWRAEYEREGAA